MGFDTPPATITPVLKQGPRCQPHLHLHLHLTSPHLPFNPKNICICSLHYLTTHPARQIPFAIHHSPLHLPLPLPPPLSSHINTSIHQYINPITSRRPPPLLLLWSRIPSRRSTTAKPPLCDRATSTRQQRHIRFLPKQDLDLTAPSARLSSDTRISAQGSGVRANIYWAAAPHHNFKVSQLRNP